MKKVSIIIIKRLQKGHFFRVGGIALRRGFGF